MTEINHIVFRNDMAPFVNTECTVFIFNAEGEFIYRFKIRACTEKQLHDLALFHPKNIFCSTNYTVFKNNTGGLLSLERIGSRIVEKIIPMLSEDEYFPY